MILTLEIQRLAAGQFSAQLHDKSGLVGAPAVYARLTSAIDAAIFSQSAEYAFLEVRYERISSGTIQMKYLKPEAARDIAIKMIAMHTYVMAQESDSARGAAVVDIEVA